MSRVEPVVKPAHERNTRQKRAIRDAFERAARPLSIDELHEDVERNVEGISVATIYRVVRTLVDDEWLDTVDVPGRPSLYERSGKAHHHHFVCNTCRRVFELEGCSSDSKARLPKGFRASGHEMTIFGACNLCQQRHATGP